MQFLNKELLLRHTAELYQLAGWIHLMQVGQGTPDIVSQAIFYSLRSQVYLGHYAWLESLVIVS